MPKVKKNITYNKGYNEEDVQKALEAIRSGSSKKAAAKKYGVPRSTLQFRLGPNFTKIEVGRSTFLTKDEEDSLVKWLIDSHRKGFPRRKIDLQLSVKSFLDANIRKTPFKDNMPGNHWYKLFLKRHPCLTERIPEAVTSASANVSDKDIKGWFNGIEKYLLEKDTFAILQDPTRIYNGDETCFLFCPKLGKVIAPKGSKNVYEVDMGEAKQNLTVMFTFSAAGDVTPPLIIFPNKRISKQVAKSVPGDWGIGMSDNGWMKADIFIKYVENILYPHIIGKGITFPVILFVDGHQTHLTYQLSQLCTKLGIILVCLYPNSTRILQPADVSNFYPLKVLWKRGVIDWRRTNPYSKLGKEHFAPILAQSLKSLKRETIINGFRASGIFPWDSSAIDYSKCLGKSNTIPKNLTENNATISVQHESAPTSTSINFEQFCTLVGTEALQQLEKNSNNCNNEFCENFNHLRKILETLKPTDLVSDQIHPDTLESNIVKNNEMIDEHHATHLHTSEQNFDESVDMIDKQHATYLHISEQNFDENDDMIDEQLGSNNKGYTEQDLDQIPIIFVDDQNVENNKKNIIIHQDVILTAINITDDPKNSFSWEKDELSGNAATNMVRNDNLNEFVKLENYLLPAATPQRKGTKQSEKRSFVLTSTECVKDLENKEKLKEEKERKKEENKQKRLQKSLQKSIMIPKKITRRKKVEKKFKKKSPLPLSIKKNEIPIESKRKENEFIFSNFSSLHSFGAISENPDKKNESHVRRLFSNSPENIKVSGNPRNNIVIRKGICYDCTFNIYLTNIGIQCQKCIRTFHVSCLEKCNIYKEKFICLSCK